MSDQGWQNAVLQELGVPRTGLVTAAQAAQAAHTGQPRDLPPEAVPVLAPRQQASQAQSSGPPPAQPQPQPQPPVQASPQPAFESPPQPAPPPPAPPREERIPLSAPPRIENGRQPEPYPAIAPEPEPVYRSEPPPVQEPEQQQYPDLAHPDLAFPDLAHPSLGLSPAEPQAPPAPPRPATPGPDPAQRQSPPPVQEPVQQPAPQPEQQQSGGWSPGTYGEDLLRNKRHGDPLIRRMGRGLRSAVGASAAHDARENADIAARIRLPVPTCRRIAVTSIRGGAGKTTVAGLMATMITQIRQDRVLAADADSGLGSLPLRLGVQTDLSLQELARARPRSWDEAARFLARSADGLWVLSNTSRGRIGAELEIDTFRAATGEMSRYFSAIVIDCGAGLLPELQRGILSEAHAQVLVTPATVDGALSARGALDWMAGNGFGALLPRTVVTLVTHTPHEDADLERAQHLLSAGGIPVVHVPYDRHLAGGTPIDLPMTGEAARFAATRIAAEVFSRAASA